MDPYRRKRILVKLGAMSSYPAGSPISRRAILGRRGPRFSVSSTRVKRGRPGLAKHVVPGKSKPLPPPYT